MSTRVRWLVTEDERARLHMAKRRGDVCADCGRRLGDGETVWIERFSIGTQWRARRGVPSYMTCTWAPVGLECTSSELLQQTKERDPETCLGCGRRMHYRSMRPNRQRALCSTRCVNRANFMKRTGPGTVG